MKKTCPEHGTFDTLVWEDNTAAYLEWIKFGGTPHDKVVNTQPCDVRNGCPFDCGICRNHVTDITTAALMTTNICDVQCPICFTQDPTEKPYMPTNDELLDIAKNYREAYGADHPIELCGGEPTVRDDLPELTADLKNLGFDHIQLNTNGLRISNDFDFLISMKKNGLTVVYLGFDSTEESAYIKKYGRKMLNVKIRAIENCVRAKIAVVLVPVVIKGVNSDCLGDIISVAKEYIPTVKAVYFQPISYFGNYPIPPHNADRITIPQVLRNLEAQTGGELAKAHFKPGGSEHALCSFTAFYMMDRAGILKPMTRYGPRGENYDSAQKVIAYNKKAWHFSETRTLAVGGMHFQDVWNIDTERLRMCRICILGRDGRIIPLCAKYVTGTDGRKLYGGIS
ncbi:MAG: radical SAM protein [Atribacterota bacterium]|nr:radical SAM protein [Atribacterota bacterium]